MPEQSPSQYIENRRVRILPLTGWVLVNVIWQMRLESEAQKNVDRLLNWRQKMSDYRWAQSGRERFMETAI